MHHFFLGCFGSSACWGADEWPNGQKKVGQGQRLTNGVNELLPFPTPFPLLCFVWPSGDVRRMVIFPHFLADVGSNRRPFTICSRKLTDGTRQTSLRLSQEPEGRGGHMENGVN
jgi:hypothetical protein